MIAEFAATDEHEAQDPDTLDIAKDYIRLKVTVDIPRLHVEVTNEFEQKLLEIHVNHLRTILIYSIAVQKFRCELGHFSVIDKWTKSNKWAEIVTSRAMSE